MEDLVDYASGFFIEKWPHWVRWVLFFPAAVIVPFLLQGITRLMTASYLGVDTSSFMLEVCSDMMIGGGFVMIGSMVAPKKQFFIGVILLVILSVFVVSPMLQPGAIEYWGISTFIHALIAVGSGITVIYQLHRYNTNQNTH